MTWRLAWLTIMFCTGCWVADADGDGWGGAADCDDANPLLGGPEIPYDGINNDCDPSTLDDDFDGDGFSHTSDCDDDNAAVGGPEVPYDGIDNDCDPLTLDDDLDRDGWLGESDCDDGNPAVGGPEVPYDGIDNDCDLRTRDDDLDTDGVPGADDCDDLDPTVDALAPWADDLTGADVVGFCTRFCSRPVVGSIRLDGTAPDADPADLACVPWVGGDVDLIGTGWSSVDALLGVTWVGGGVQITGNPGFTDAHAQAWVDSLVEVGAGALVAGNGGAR